MGLVTILLSPANSTTTYIQEVIKTLEMFDETAKTQVDGFFDSRQRNLADEGVGPVLDSPALVHKKANALLVALNSKKRTAGRGLSYNAVSPSDIKQLNKIMKRLGTPLQGIAIAHTIQVNMWKLELLEHNKNASPFSNLAPPKISVINFSSPLILTPFAEYGIRGDPHKADSLSSNGKGDRHDDRNEVDEPAEGSDTKMNINIYGKSSILLNPPTIFDDKASLAPSSSCKSDSDGTNIDQQQAIQHDSGLVPPLSTSPSSSQHNVSVALDDVTFKLNTQRQEYNAILGQIRHTHNTLMSACSLATLGNIKRLRRMQSIDPRYQDKPLLYKYIFGKRGTPDTDASYDPSVDHSVALLLAIQRFDSERLDGLKRLFDDNHQPFRRLLLILNLQFSVRTWAENLYMLTSLIFAMDQARRRRRLFFPGLTSCCFFGEQKGLSFDLESHGAGSALDRRLSLERTSCQHIASSSPLADPALVYKINSDIRWNTSNISNRSDLESGLSIHHQQRHEHNATDDFHGSFTNLMQQVSQKCNITTPSVMVDTSTYHDPDASYPTTRLQRIFYILWSFGERHVYTSDTAFALRASIVVTALTLPGFLEQSLTWYHTARCQWATVVALIWMGPSVGSSFFG